MASLRDIGCVRLDRRLCVAAFVVGLSAAAAFAAEPAPAPAGGAKDAVVDAGHSPPPAAKASERDAGERADRPHAAAPTQTANPNRATDRVERSANPSPNRASKAGAGAPLERATQFVPSVQHVPQISARDRLFKLIHGARPPQTARLRPPGTRITAPSVPMRNAIGIAIAPAAPPRTAPAPHWGQSPDRVANATRPGATVALPNAWHAPITVPAAPARGSLNGTTLVRIGSGAAVIGGPARTTTGINGTTLRPKH